MATITDEAGAIEATGAGNRPPLAAVTATPSAGPLPLGLIPPGSGPPLGRRLEAPRLEVPVLAQRQAHPVVAEAEQEAARDRHVVDAGGRLRLRVGGLLHQRDQAVSQTLGDLLEVESPLTNTTLQRS